jgi:RimJ/RimL family protein N-acetyltransferase
MKLPKELLTERLRLRPPTMSDAETIFERYSQDPEVSRYVTWTPHRTIDETVAYLRRLLDAEEEKSYGYLVFERQSGQLLGSVGAGVVGAQGSRVQFGYCFARDAWGRGFATETARAFVDAVMQDVSIWRIQAFCDVENRASARVLEKCGLEFEGTLRRYMALPNLGDAPRDMLCYAKVRA